MSVRLTRRDGRAASMQPANKRVAISRASSSFTCIPMIDVDQSLVQRRQAFQHGRQPGLCRTSLYILLAAKPARHAREIAVDQPRRHDHTDTN
jgi:hypothetical protein